MRAIPRETTGGKVVQPKVDVEYEFDNIEAIQQAVRIGSGLPLLARQTLDRDIQAVTRLIERLRKPGTVSWAA
jgi:hypothetical protein